MRTGAEFVDGGLKHRARGVLALLNLVTVAALLRMARRRHRSEFAPATFGPPIWAELPDDVEMNPLVYGTDQSDYEIWTDVAFRLSRLPRLLLVLLAGSIVYLVGLGIAAMGGFEIEYMKTPAVYIGAAGISWVLGCIRWGSLRVHLMFRDLRPVFPVDDESYLEVIKPWMRRFAQHRRNLVACTLLFAVALLLVVIAFYLPNDIREYHLQSLRPPVFPAAWYVPHDRPLKVVIVLWYGLVCAALIGTGARVLMVNVLLLWRLRDLPVVALGNVVRSRLRGITNFYVLVSMTWWIGIGLFALTFLNHYDVIAVALMGSMALLGMLTFLVPQLVFRHYILASYQLICSWALSEHLEAWKLKWDGGPSKTAHSVLTRSAGSPTLADLVEATAKPTSWVYDSEDLLLLVIGQALALAMILIQVFLH